MQQLCGYNYFFLSTQKLLLLSKPFPPWTLIHYNEYDHLFFFRQGFTGALATAVGNEKKQQVPLFACSLRGVSLFLIRGEGRGVSRNWVRGFRPTP